MRKRHRARKAKRERQTFVASRAWVFLVLKESEIYVARKARSGAKSSYLVPQS